MTLDGMDEALDRLLEPVEQDPIPNPLAKPKSAQWLPGVVWEGSEGTVTTTAIPIEESPDWDSVLRIWGLDPANFSVVEPVLFNAWGNPDGILNRQWKAKVVRKGTVKEQADISDLVDEIKKHKKQPQAQITGEGVFCVVLADWQMGKPDGDGLKGTAKRILDGIDSVEHRIKELRRLKRPIGKLIVLWTGDSVEGCIGHYEQQVFGVELDRRDQVKIARRLLRDALIRWAKLFDDVSVVAVAGNHGENRNSSGKSYTSLNDNDDVAIVEQVAEILGSNPDAYGHVKFAIPKDKLSITIESAGWILGITHGHIAKVSGASPELKIKKWLEGQSFGRQPMGDADVVVTGHWHHLRAADWGGVMWLQAPALDGGSLWWKEMTGASAETGILTFCMYPEKRVADMAVL